LGTDRHAAATFHFIVVAAVSTIPNSQALSTRQSIAVSALALANQSQQSVLQAPASGLAGTTLTESIAKLGQWPTWQTILEENRSFTIN
jgi:hypothetical protein